MIRSFFGVSARNRSLIVRVLPALLVALAVAVRAGGVTNGQISAI